MKNKWIFSLLLCALPFCASEGYGKTNEPVAQSSHAPAGLEFIQANMKKINDSLGPYLSTYTPLFPYIKDGPAEIKAIGIENCFDSGPDVVATIIAEISQNDKKYKAMFVVNMKKETQDRQLKLLFIGDTVISSTLFLDIMPVLMELHVKSESLKKGGNVFVELLGGNEKESYLIGVNVFSPVEKEKVLVRLIPDGKGGTHFRINPPEDEIKLLKKERVK